MQVNSEKNIVIKVNNTLKFDMPNMEDLGSFSYVELTWCPRTNN